MRSASFGPTTPTRSTVLRDISGFALFSDGVAGEVHVAAHRALDSGRLAEGHLELRGWLGDRAAHSSGLVHLHWHLLVFEIAARDLEAANRRLERHLLPAVVFREAKTDAPSALWRLRVAGREPSSASWQKAATHAKAALQHEKSPFVVLHHLLALAGAEDHRALEAWNRRCSAARKQGHLQTYALGLEAFARGDYELATELLCRSADALGQSCGGSDAQSGLVCMVAMYTKRYAAEVSPPSVAA
jgi:hypothetical protein